MRRQYKKGSRNYSVNNIIIGGVILMVLIVGIVIVIIPKDTITVSGDKNEVERMGIRTREGRVRNEQGYDAYDENTWTDEDDPNVWMQS